MLYNTASLSLDPTVCARTGRKKLLFFVETTTLEIDYLSSHEPVRIEHPCLNRPRKDVRSSALAHTGIAILSFERMHSYSDTQLSRTVRITLTRLTPTNLSNPVSAKSSNMHASTRIESYARNRSQYFESRLPTSRSDVRVAALTAEVGSRCAFRLHRERTQTSSQESEA